MIFEGDMFFDQPDIGDYQPDMVQNGLSEARAVLNHGGLIISHEGLIKKHIVPKKSCYYYYYNLSISKCESNMLLKGADVMCLCIAL